MRRSVLSRNLKNEEVMARVGPQRYGGGRGDGKVGLQVAMLLIMQVSQADVYFFPYFLNVQN